MLTGKRILLMLIVGLFMVTLSFAKGMFTTVRITDDATGDVIELVGDDHDMLTQFFLFDSCGHQSTADMQHLTNGYEIERGSVLMGTFEPFDKIVYYPAAKGQRGYIHYIGLVDARGNKDGGSEYDNHWFYVNPAAEPYLRELLFDEPVIESPFGTSLQYVLGRSCF